MDPTDAADGDHAFVGRKPAVGGRAVQAARLLPAPRSHPARTDPRASRLVYAFHHRQTRRSVRGQMGSSARAASVPALSVAGCEAASATVSCQSFAHPQTRPLIADTTLD